VVAETHWTIDETQSSKEETAHTETMAGYQQAKLWEDEGTESSIAKDGS